MVKGKDFTEIFKAYVPGAKLRRVQKGYLTNCPFHSDKSPSFMIYRDGWRCFAGCGHGDAVDFLVKLNNQRPIEAAKEIAGMYGFADVNDFTPKQRKLLAEKQREEELLKAFRKWERETFVRLVGFRDTIQKTLDTYGLDAPEPVLEIVRDYWPQLNHCIETLATGTDEEKLALFKWRLL